MLDLDFPLVDPHFHHWDPVTTPRAASPIARLLHRWPRAYRKAADLLIPPAAKNFAPDYSIIHPYLPADYAKDAAGLRIDTVVHVEAAWQGRGQLGVVGETRWLDQLDFGGVKLGAIVGHADLRSAQVDEVLAAHQGASARFRGIRQKAAHHAERAVLSFAKAPGLYRDRDFLRGFERLVARGLRFDAWCYSTQLGEVVELAARFPEASIVLDHVGTPVGVGGQVGATGASEQARARIFGAWRDDLARLAEHEHVHAKISGLAMPVLGFDFHRRASPPSSDELCAAFRPLVHHALDVFGAERSFFASNFPMDRPSVPMPTLFAAYLRLAREHRSSAPRALFRDNALRFYGI